MIAYFILSPYFAKKHFLLQLYPKDLAEALDFQFIRTQLAKLCSSARAKDMALELQPIQDLSALRKTLKETDQILSLLLSDENFPNLEHPPLGAFLPRISIKGHALREEQYAEIRSLALNYRDIRRFIDGKKDRLPALWRNLEVLFSEKTVIEEIDRVIDDRAQVRSNASPELQKIRRDLIKKRASAERIFQRSLKKMRDKGILADFDESVSESRRVLAIQSAYKGQVQGIQHGSSHRQSITFIEPGETVEINNQITELIEDEQEEIKRILRELSAILSPYRAHLEEIETQLVHLDYHRAKAYLSHREKACVPYISREKRIVLREAYNPVLRHFNRLKEKDTVALNLELHPQQRLLVISGPNAGGKSLSLKTVGLLQIMLQSGLPVPVHPESEMCLFEQILGDIGDSQSIENELSTYSSKLQKMEHFLRHADEESLLLIDEFGSGSDPELGSALAQIFLEKLNGFKSFGILTTHFNSIKALAAETEGIVNGAMLFERETFKPRYELIIGQPGSSYTFEVAQRSGIAKHIIEEARGRVQQNTLEVDRLLVQIQEDKVSIENTRLQQEAELQNLRGLKAEQQQKISKLEDKLSKQTKLNQEEDRVMYWGQRFQKLIDSWMDQKTQKDKKEVIARFIAMLNQRSGEVQKEEGQNLQKKMAVRHKNIDKYTREPISIGAQVKIIDSGIIGTLIEQKGSKYIIALGGNLRASLDREKFVRSDAPIGDKPKVKKRKKTFKKQGDKPVLKELKPAPKESSSSKRQETENTKGSKQSPKNAQAKQPNNKAPKETAKAQSKQDRKPAKEKPQAKNSTKHEPRPSKNKTPASKHIKKQDPSDT